MKKYFIEFTVAMVCYVVLLLLSVFLLKEMDPASLFRVPVALLPMIPAIGICWVVIRQLRSMDELQRKIQFEALSWAFGLTAVTTFSYGFLETIGFPKLSYFLIWPVMAAFWIVALSASKKRYS